MNEKIAFPDAFGTRMALFVDTEEEFDWSDSLSRDEHGVSAVPALREGQAMFEAAGLAPCYLVDTPILDSGEAIEILGEMLESGTASVGAHLHPWVTPPFDEDVSARNSYAGNLPEAMERQKIRHVRSLIADRLGTAPRAYRAGRYGVGPNTFVSWPKRASFVTLRCGRCSITAAMVAPIFVRTVSIPVASAQTAQ